MGENDSTFNSSETEDEALDEESQKILQRIQQRRQQWAKSEEELEQSLHDEIRDASKRHMDLEKEFDIRIAYCSRTEHKLTERLQKLYDEDFDDDEADEAEAEYEELQSVLQALRKHQARWKNEADKASVGYQSVQEKLNQEIGRLTSELEKLSASKNLKVAMAKAYQSLMGVELVLGEVSETTENLLEMKFSSVGGLSQELIIVVDMSTKKVKRSWPQLSSEEVRKLEQILGNGSKNLPRFAATSRRYLQSRLANLASSSSSGGDGNLAL